MAGRPSAALVLGLMSGALAAVTFLPTVIPVTRMVHDAEQTVAMRQSLSTAHAVARSVKLGVPVLDPFLSETGADMIHVVEHSGAEVYRLGGGLPVIDYSALCAQTTASAIFQEERDNTWAAACVDTLKHRVVVAHQVAHQSPNQVLYLISLLALFVGVITAVGVLRLLSPISEISRALQRVGAGHRGVRMDSTGLAELDELVSRMNAAARAMEDREDAILSRVQVVQELARLVAHEIRNPLQSLDFLASLMAGEENAEERTQLMEAIRTEIRALDLVVVRLLQDSARSGALHITKTVQSLGPMVEQLVALNRPEALLGGTTVNIGRVSWRPVPVDLALISRSIENLIRNAIQAVAELPEGEVTVSVYEEEEHMVVLVEDNGPGVSEDLVDTLFEPGVSGRAEGLGLGLSLVRGVLDAHGGYIECGRSSSGGASFTGRLPLGTDSEDEGAVAAA